MESAFGWRVAETQVWRNTWGSGVSGRVEITLDPKYLVEGNFIMSEWHYIRNEKQIGPVSLEDLINKKNSGEIAPTDLVWSAGMGDWLPIQEAQQSGASLSKHEGEARGLVCLTELSDAAAESLSKHESDSPSSHPARGCITWRAAIDFLNDDNADEVESGASIEGLNWGTSIDKEAAEVLAEYHGVLRLKGLTKISDDVAEALSRFEGEGLCLDGLVEVTEGNLEHLVNLDTDHLQISGAIMNLANVSSFLAECHGTLILNGLTKISADAAMALSRFEGEALALDGLTELSDAAAESLSKHEGALGLEGLTELSDAAAESLSKHLGDLFLDGLTELSDAAANSLSKLLGNLSLAGLMELSDAAAESLSEHQGELSLDGLTELSDAAAESLSKHLGNLFLNGLTELSDAAADSLSKQKDYLIHSLMELSDEDENYEDASVSIDSIKIDEGNPSDEFIVKVDFYYCEVSYEGYTIADRETISVLNRELDSGREVYTPNMPGDWCEEFEISKLESAFTVHSEKAEDVEAMRKLFGESIGNVDLITMITDMVATDKLAEESDDDDDDSDDSDDYSDDDDDSDGAKIYDHISLEVAQKYLDHGWFDVDLTEATSITSEAAELLSKSKEDQISLCGLTELPLDVAEGLAKYKGALFLDGLTELSDAAAESLSKHQGELSLDGLTELSDSVACALSKHKGEIELRSVVELSTRSAEALASSCYNLNLHGLTQISDSVARELAKHKTGWLYLGVTALSDTAAEALSNHQGESLWLIDLKEISDQGRAFLSSYKGVLNGHS